MSRFHKMHGLGNDFVVVDARAHPITMSSQRARAIADRRTGIGCDQLVILEASPDADAVMRIWNADGGEVEACGNAARAVAVLIGRATLLTAGGPIGVAPDGDGASVDMGRPRFDWNAIPLSYPMDTACLPVAWEPLQDAAAVNVGNPHLVFFVDDIAKIDLAVLGPVIEHDPLFPDRINVNIAEVTSPSSIRMRTWERGVGLTRACGTGACATAVVAIRQKRVNSPIDMSLPGGTLRIEWAGGEIHMVGPAMHVFSGDADWDRFDA